MRSTLRASPLCVSTALGEGLLLRRRRAGTTAETPNPASDLGLASRLASSNPEVPMPSVKPLTLQVSDLVSWFRNGSLVVNEDFQRRAVWNKQASTYLVDPLLSGLPIPNIYIRTKIDAAT